MKRKTRNTLPSKNQIENYIAGLSRRLTRTDNNNHAAIARIKADIERLQKCAKAKEVVWSKYLGRKDNFKGLPARRNPAFIRGGNEPRYI